MSIGTLKKACLCVFSRFNPGDVVVRHYLTGDRFHLHSFYHRSYWFHGKRRESETMRMFSRLISPGNCALDIGGHIGYVALYLSSLVGRKGRVYVFEPAPNNLRYLRKNIENSPNISLVPKAVGNADGRVKMFIESITGQNCSLIKDYVMRRNAERAGMAGPKVYETDVDVVPLDRFVEGENIKPDFVKIDVEGFEWEVLQGATRLLNNVKPMLMVEMRNNKEEVHAFLKKQGYLLFTPRMEPIHADEDCRDNVFCLHEHIHADKLQRLLRNAA